MKFLGKFLAAGLISIALFYGRPVSAADDFNRWLDALKQQAQAEGISAGTLAVVLDGVQSNELVLKLDQNQPEFKLSLTEYLNRVMPKSRVRSGRKKIRENQQLLRDVAARFKVQPRFLVALWGIETDFGRVTGSLPVVEALVTLAYDPRRSVFFRRELLAALRIIDDGWITNSQLEGSWAGAFGGLQFLPSVFLKYAIDLDGDGRIDPWRNKGDLFASGANYLAKSGWHLDETWGREVILPPDFDVKLTGLANKKRISAWQALGVRRINGVDLPSRELLSSIIMPQNGRRTFIVYNNFEVLLKWNRSIYYALAVGIFSDQLHL